MAVHDNRLRRTLYSDNPTFEDEDKSVCGVVYVGTESSGGAWQSKPSSGGSFPFQHPAHISASRERRCCTKRVVVISAIALLVVLAVTIGVAIGSSRSRQAQPKSPAPAAGTAADRPAAPPAAAPAKAAVVTTVPFSVWAAATPPAGQTDYTCDIMFGTDQAINRYTTSIEAAYAAQLAPLGAATINVTKVTCNSVTYDLPSHDDSSPATRRLLQQQKSAEQVLEILTQFEIRIHKVTDGPSPAISKETIWMIQARKCAENDSKSVIPKVLADVYSMTVAISSMQVLQLPGVIVSSSSSSVVTASTAGATGTTETGEMVVTRTTTDPFTGAVINTQIITIPAAAAAAAATPDGSSDTGLPAMTPITAHHPTSSSSSSNVSSSNASSTAAGCPQPCILYNAEAQCINGNCVVQTCQPGWEDCDGLDANGCEANVLRYFSDSAHCGGCGKVCLAPLACSEGVCIMPPSGDSSTPAVHPPPQQQQKKPEPIPGSQQPANDSSSGTAHDEPAASTASQQQQQQTLPRPQPISNTTVTEPPSSSTAVPGLKPTQPATDATAAPPAAVTAPAKPDQPAGEPDQPGLTPAAEPEPPADTKSIKGLPILYDDMVRITPTDNTRIIDVLANDNLNGYAPQDTTLSLLMQPAAGSARVVPASPYALAGTPESRPRIEYTAAGPLAAGDEIQMYYTVKVPGVHDVAGPATATVLGAYTKINTSLLDCSPTSKSTQGNALSALSHADDATAAVDLPFAVEMYGTNYTTATISSNGWVSFGDSQASEPCNMASEWPGAQCLGSGPVIAVFWDDLVPDSVLTYHDESLGAFIIQWTNVMFSGSNTPLGTFQAYVFQNGTVGYVYRDIFGADASLGSEAIIGIRGPSSNSPAFKKLLRGKEYRDLGATADSHGTWLWASTADMPDYVLTASAQSRSLNPGLALISYPQIRSSRSAKPKTLDVQGNSRSDQAGAGSVREAQINSPGAFKPWIVNPRQPLPLLTTPNSPARPILLQPTARQTPSGGSQVATIGWRMPAGSSPVQQFRLYVAADPLFSELLRQPAGNAFDPDIAGSTRSVDVALDNRFVGRNVYVLLMACYKDVCSKSCIGQFALRPRRAAA